MSNALNDSSQVIPKDFQVIGCPVGNGSSECSRGCGGWYPINTAVLTQAVLGNTIKPDRLCGPLRERILAAQAFLALARQVQPPQI